MLDGVGGDAPFSTLSKLADSLVVTLAADRLFDSDNTSIENTAGDAEFVDEATAKAKTSATATTTSTLLEASALAAIETATTVALTESHSSVPTRADDDAAAQHIAAVSTAADVVRGRWVLKGYLKCVAYTLVGDPIKEDNWDLALEQSQYDARSKFRVLARQSGISRDSALDAHETL